MKSKEDSLTRATDIAQAARRRAQLIQTELSLGASLCDLAETEMTLGNREHAGQVLSKAHNALTTAKTRLADGDFPRTHVQDLGRQISKLENRYHTIRRKLAEAA